MFSLCFGEDNNDQAPRNATAASMETRAVSRAEVQKTIGALRKEFRNNMTRFEARHSALVATAIYGCAKGWLPDYPQHIGRAMFWMELHSRTARKKDPELAALFIETLKLLHELQPSYERKFDIRPLQH